MKITPERLRKIIKEELEAVMNEEETKTVAGVIEDLKAAKPARRRMVISDFEAIVDGFADPSILKYYPNWKEEDFQKVIDALES